MNCKIPLVTHRQAAICSDFGAGANEDGWHYGINWGRDCDDPETADLRNVVEGDPAQMDQVNI